MLEQCGSGIPRDEVGAAEEVIKVVRADPYRILHGKEA